MKKSHQENGTNSGERSLYTYDISISSSYFKGVIVRTV